MLDEHSRSLFGSALLKSRHYTPRTHDRRRSPSCCYCLAISTTTPTRLFFFFFFSPTRHFESSFHYDIGFARTENTDRGRSATKEEYLQFDFLGWWVCSTLLGDDLLLWISVLGKVVVFQSAYSRRSRTSRNYLFNDTQFHQINNDKELKTLSSCTLTHSLKMNQSLIHPQLIITNYYYYYDWPNYSLQQKTLSFLASLARVIGV